MLKLEIMLHVAPAVILGVHTRYLSGKSLLVGVIGGLAVTIWLKFFPEFSPSLFGIHPGMWGLVVNITLIGFFYKLFDEKLLLSQSKMEN